MICVHQWPLEETRTQSKGCVYMAACEADGVPYSARSRYGAPNELARVLVAAGIPDAPMVVTHRGLRGEMTYRSFDEAAKWTHEESASVPLHRVPYARVVAARERARRTGVEGAKQGLSAPAATPVALGASQAQIAVPDGAP